MLISKPWQYSLIFGTIITILGFTSAEGFNLIKEHVVLKATVAMQGEQLNRIEATGSATKSQVDVLSGMVNQLLRNQKASQEITLSENDDCIDCDSIM